MWIVSLYIFLCIYMWQATLICTLKADNCMYLHLPTPHPFPSGHAIPAHVYALITQNSCRTDFPKSSITANSIFSLPCNALILHVQLAYSHVKFLQNEWENNRRTRSWLYDVFKFHRFVTWPIMKIVSVVYGDWSENRPNRHIPGVFVFVLSCFLLLLLHLAYDMEHVYKHNIISDS